MTHEPLPLPMAYNLDLEPVPRAEPGAATFAQVESLYLKWMLAKPKTLMCHPSVYMSIACGPWPERATYQFLTGGVDRIYGIAIEVDANMEPGAWRLMAGDEKIDSGVIAT